jgi:AraC-like DNA-binding protein
LAQIVGWQVETAYPVHEPPNSMTRSKINTGSRGPDLPLIQLRLVTPFVNELERCGKRSADVLAEFSLERKNLLDENHFVTAATMYRLAERLGEYSGNPYFGVLVGEKLDMLNWPPTIQAVKRASTVGEFLFRFMESARQQENSVTFVLKSVGDRTSIRERRFTDTGIKPRHNDGFTIAYLLSVIRLALGHNWDGSRVVARVSDPDVVPNHYMGIRTATGDTLGAEISFPTNWMILKVSGAGDLDSGVNQPTLSFPATNLIDAFCFAVQPHIHDTQLDANLAAQICGMKKRTLTRKLQYAGTTITGEIHAMKRSRAEQELSESEKPIRVIAHSVGYSDPVVFSRAFKRWTGYTPSEYRAKSRSR